MVLNSRTGKEGTNKKRGSLCIHRSDVIIIGLLYMYIPLFIFILSWVELGIAIAVSLAMIGALVLYLRELLKKNKRIKRMYFE